jgi:sodium transport system ATP-binding protein
LIEIRDLRKRFGDVHAVNGLSLTARDGTITGLIGPNGAGKTTAFRTVYGLLSPDDGVVRVDNFDVTRDRLTVQKHLGVLPDVRGLYPRLTGREHIRFYGELHGLSGDDLEQKIEALIDRLDMTSFADRRARGYSRGQELKIALGRALVHKPHNLILDEPTNGLDVVSSRAVRSLILEMRDNGHCVLLSSHIMAEVAVLCDYLVIVSEGEVLTEGTPDELLRRFTVHDLEEVFVASIAQATSRRAV